MSRYSTGLDLIAPRLIFEFHNQQSFVAQVRSERKDFLLFKEAKNNFQNHKI